MSERINEIMAEIEKEADLDGLATVQGKAVGQKLGLSGTVVSTYIRHMAKQHMFESCTSMKGHGYTIQLKGFE